MPKNASNNVAILDAGSRRGTDFVTITSATDPRIAPYSDLRRSRQRVNENSIALVEGLTQFETLLASELPICGVLLETQHFAAYSELLAERLEPDAPCYVAERDVLSELVGYRHHTGVMALTRPRPEILLGELKPPVVALNGLVDAENVGSIARSCVAFGVRSLLIDSQTAHPHLRRAIRVSLAASLFLDVCRVDRLEHALDEVKDKIDIIGVEHCSDAKALGDYAFSNRTLLVFGNEGAGVHPEVLKRCATIVQIPMLNTRVSSLNVGAAAAIVLERLFSWQG